MEILTFSSSSSNDGLSMSAFRYGRNLGVLSKSRITSLGIVRSEAPLQQCDRPWDAILQDFEILRAESTGTNMFRGEKTETDDSKICLGLEKRSRIANIRAV